MTVIVILTALEVEYAAVREHLTEVESYRHREGTYFDIGSLRNRPDAKVALTSIEMGNLAAATLTERANAEFRPATMMFVGVAGGLHDWLALGDIVVGTRIYEFHGGRSVDGNFLNRPRAWDLSHAVLQTVRRVDRSDSWRENLPQRGRGSKPKVYFGPIAAGSVLLDSKKSQVAEHIHKNYNDAIAIEMESAGFAEAGHLNTSLPTVTIRGISDHAGGQKTRTDGQGWQQISARNAAAFAATLARQLDHETTARQAESKPLTGWQNNTNNVSGNAIVGQQAGTNFGANKFTFGSAKDDR